MPIYYNEASLQDECMRDLKAVAAVLKFAVQTVAAAAEDKAVRQPSKRLVTVCCLAVRALSGACLSGPVKTRSIHDGCRRRPHQLCTVPTVDQPM